MGELIEFLGESTLTRILNFLKEIPNDTSKEEIIKGTGVSRNSFFKTWKKIEEHELVKETRKVGKSTMFVLDENSDIVKKLSELEYVLVKDSSTIDKEEEMVSYVG
ncbi:MAG: hypothetical protein ISS36_04195 [Candidatus Aenigmarchaeota archaeon]|nr:hypothetical protein [Candidatus Aenigmarchaeota archaeon]